ncbi:MAG TPA: folylpolyglutamate synthase/dihydrofolate synthase family protein [Myxococcales bacterium]|nr:folylpolyglutamate synthase/dihydrofolate synthase family protein [Myxococcales bacterium]
MDFARLKELLFVRGNFGVKLGLDRMREACALLGHPERGAPALHVAGTNGKGSTCAFAEAALRAAGLRTGLYTSPHLNHFCERIRVGGEPISEERACELLEEVRSRVSWALSDPGLTFFEIVTLMALLAFRGLDAAVIEVGLGGRLDATNVVQPRACAVSALGLEHTQYLGPTLRHIAAEKAGIFKPGVPAVSAGQPRAAAGVLQRRADELGIPLWRPGRDYRFESREGHPFCYQGPRWTVRAELGLAGHHQRANAALASALLEASGLCEPRHAEAGLRTARWPARLEQVNGVYLDGAHNPHAVRALARALPQILADRPLNLVFGALADKDAGAMLQALAPLAASIHYCAPDSPRAIPPRSLALLHPGEVHESVAAALAAARALPGVALCCGSLYLAGEARALLLGEANAPMPAERL